MTPRHFTLEEANAMLPWLAETFSALMPIREELVQEQERLLVMMRGGRGNGSSSHGTEITELQRKVDLLTEDLQRVAREISQRGIIVRDIGRWLVDFPSMREGREVYLCWVRGELEIGFWHETVTGFSNRQPI
ncbi:MAG: hypothetical protein CMJ45_00155 [Planctomyces sp.]|nr:hypothetical protein [Planctomyces sp.]